MTEHEKNLRDLAAMFAMAGLLAKGVNSSIPKKAFDLADQFMEQRKEQTDDRGN